MLKADAEKLKPSGSFYVAPPYFVKVHFPQLTWILEHAFDSQGLVPISFFGLSLNLDAHTLEKTQESELLQ